MNIFVLDTDPIVAASYLCDKHVPKMVLETAQMLSAAHRIVDPSDRIGIQNELYKTTHKNHPCVRWVCEEERFYTWLYAHFIGLCSEYTTRYGKVHKSQSLASYFKTSPFSFLPIIGYNTSPISVHNDEFAQAMPDVYKNPYDAVRAYRAYYKGEKAKFAKWEKSTPAPSWW